MHRYEYDIVFKHRKKLSKHRSGGVGVIFKTCYEDNIKVIHTDTQDVLWFLFNFEESRILFGNCYIPPENSRFFKRDIFEQIDLDIVNFHTNLSYTELCIMGDFNAKTKNLQDFVEIDNRLGELIGLDNELLVDQNLEDFFLNYFAYKEKG